ncbi:hypothetical protein D3C76_1693190 [compost metagenome]
MAKMFLVMLRICSTSLVSMAIWPRLRSHIARMVFSGSDAWQRVSYRLYNSSFRILRDS